MKFSLLKSQGSGNDFFLIDIRSYDGAVNNGLKKKLAIFLCDRESEFGADGILYVDNSLIADAKMVIFNADGSEAEMCGNGIRIVARYVAEQAGKSNVVIENTTGIKYPLNLVDNFYPGLTAYELSFPKADFRASSVPILISGEQLINELIPELSATIKFTALALPNPHIAGFLDNINESDLKTIGIKANDLHQVLPNGVNVNLGKIISSNSIYVATYERGVGITYSCGTGMFSTAVSAVVNRLVNKGEWTTLFNKGGYTRCLVNDDLSGRMIGDATYVYQADIDFDFDGDNLFNAVKGNVFDQENEAYHNLLLQVNHEDQ
jgi:diaminopimelate epimerase